MTIKRSRYILPAILLPIVDVIRLFCNYSYVFSRRNVFDLKQKCLRCVQLRFVIEQNVCRAFVLPFVASIKTIHSFVINFIFSVQISNILSSQLKVDSINLQLDLRNGLRMKFWSVSLFCRPRVISILRVYFSP